MSGMAPSLEGLRSRRRPGLPADVQAQEVEPGVVPQAVEVRLGQPPLLEVDVGPDDRLLLEDRLPPPRPAGGLGWRARWRRAGRGPPAAWRPGGTPPPTSRASRRSGCPRP